MDDQGTPFAIECGDLSIYNPLKVDANALLEAYPDGCIAPGVTIDDLIANEVLVGGTKEAIGCSYEVGLGNGNFPGGITIDADDCSIQGTVASSENFGMHVWITTFTQGPVKAFVPYCAPQGVQSAGAYGVAQSFMGADATFKVGTVQQTGNFATYGAGGDPRVEVSQVCDAPACFYKFYYAVNPLSVMASVSANPNGKLGMGMAFDGFFHSLAFAVVSDVSKSITGRHWVANFDFLYCISDTESDCDTKEHATSYGEGSNYTFGVVVRP